MRSTGRPSSGVRSSATLVSMSAPAARSSTERVADELGLRAGDLALQRAEHEMRGVDALLGGVVQLPRDPLTLALDREALGAQALAAQAREHVGGVGESEDHDERHHEVRRDRLQADRARQRVGVQLGVGGDAEDRRA